jgi:hypothetical protein
VKKTRQFVHKPCASVNAHGRLFTTLVFTLLHFSVSDLYILMTGLPILLQENM